MADLPTFADLFDAAEREILIKPTPFNPRILRTEGSDVNIAIAASAAMAEEIGRFAQAVFGETFLALAAAAGGDVLDRWIFDRLQLTRRKAQASVVTLRFTRTGLAGFTIGAGFVVSASDGTTFETINDLPFPANNAGPLSVLAVAQQTGPGGNVAAGTIATLVSSAEDPTVAVTNPEPAAGGTEEETNTEFAARARDFFVNARRGTRQAILNGGLDTPGVQQATVIELLDSNGLPGFRGQLIVADANGQANAALAARVVENLLEYRALGIPILVSAGTPQFVQITATGLQFEAGANTTAVLQDARGRILAATNALSPQQTLRIATLYAALADTPKLIVPAGAIVEPAGDLVPASGGVLRTRADLVSLNGT